MLWKKGEGGDKEVKEATKRCDAEFFAIVLISITVSGTGPFIFGIRCLVTEQRAVALIYS